MMMEEIVQTCVNETVAAAAVRCIGRAFHTDIETVARAYGMSTGAFTALAVQRFSRRADEAEARAVRSVMNGAQEPILVGLHRILCIMLAAAAQSNAIEAADFPLEIHPAEIDRFEACHTYTCCR